MVFLFLLSYALRKGKANAFFARIGANSAKTALFPPMEPPLRDRLKREVNLVDEYLCLTDLLDQDLSAYEYFQTLSPELQDKLRREDEVRSYADLQSRAAEG